MDARAHYQYLHAAIMVALLSHLGLIHSARSSLLSEEALPCLTKPKQNFSSREANFET